MICKNCGSEIADNATECPFCLIEINEAYRNQVRQERMVQADHARHAEELAAKKAAGLRRNAQKAQMIAARKLAAARKAEAKAAHKAEIARRAEAKASRKMEEARRAEAEAARRIEELRRADAEAAQKASFARQAESSQYQASQQPYIRSIPTPQYGTQTIPQPQYPQQTGQVLRQYPYDTD